MLITAKPLMNKGGEGIPGYVLQFRLDRLESTSCGMGEVVSGDTNPHRRMNRIHFEVGTST
jgi:hypothetical protein